MNAARKASPEGKREICLRFMVNATEQREIDKLAKFYGYTNVSEYLRQVALGFRQSDRKELEEK